MSHWSGAHRSFAVEQYLKNGESLVRARRTFCTHFNIRRLSDGPSTQLIWSWVQRFRQEGTTLNRAPPGPSTSVATPERVSEVQNEIIRNPRKSIRKIAASTGIKKSTVQVILKKKLRLHPYKMQIVQGLNERDYPLREIFARTMLERFRTPTAKCPTRQVFVRAGRSHCIESCNAETMCGEVRVPEHHLNPCYVCNSTGHNCRVLPRVQTGILEEDVVDSDGAPIDTNEHPEDSLKPEEVVGVEDTDFVLYVSAVETERCKRGLTVAYASHCQQESALDRPVAGHANFCPGELSTKYRDLPSVLSTVKHEMLHALGFSVSLFAFYRDDNGEPLTERRPDTGNPPLDEELQIHKWSDRVVRNVTRKKWMIRGGYMERTLHMMVTPRVVKEVREHFNCSELEGAELEDQGGDGTHLTHWEKRVFEVSKTGVHRASPEELVIRTRIRRLKLSLVGRLERSPNLPSWHIGAVVAMRTRRCTGTHTQNSVFSRITFAALEDTGWYRAVYELATPLHWGKGLGCKIRHEIVQGMAQLTKVQVLALLCCFTNT
ncbi:hypothetical protein ACJJTC_002241 [Scirpophaga incertulas]